MKPPKISFIGVITLLFIVLKLTNYVDWSWWVVLSPLWGSILFVLVYGLIAYLNEKYD